MKSDIMLRFRMNSKDYDELVKKATNEGYFNISNYLRNALSGNLAEIRKLIREIHCLLNEL